MVDKKIILDGSYSEDTRVVLLNEKNKIESFEYINSDKKHIKGNIYLAVVTRVESALQAAFIDYGDEKKGFLSFCEINQEYYNKKKVKLNLIDDAKIKNMLVDNQVLNCKDSDIDIDKLKESISSSESKEVVDDINGDSFIDVIDVENISKKREEEVKIQDVIKKGQMLLVQLVKESRGSKCASFTTYISLIGRYCILMPNKDGNSGVSKKISNFLQRDKLKSLIESFLNNLDNNKISIIIRTASDGISLEKIRSDYLQLVKLWNKISSSANKAFVSMLIHKEDKISQIIKGMYDNSVSKIIVQGDDLYNKVKKSTELILDSSTNVVPHNDKSLLFTFFNVEDQITSLYQPRVDLDSGGYIVINPAEGMTLIDVNSGKSKSYDNVEQTALSTNIEAAQVIALHLRLRDISGLIVVDFIDMKESDNRILIKKVFNKFLTKDKAKIQVAPISKFGLLEMSRQFMSSSFLQKHTQICNYCNGKGVVRKSIVTSILILKNIENEILSDSLKIDVVNVYANTNVILFLLNNKKLSLLQLEKKYLVKINCFVDKNESREGFSLEKISLDSKN